MSSEPDETLSAASAPAVVLDGDLPAGSLFAGRYLVEEKVGHGGMGAVYRVQDRMLGETVALKLLTLGSERAVERFLREVKLARRVTHPNVARTHDLGSLAGLHFLTMEYVAGRSLEATLHEQGALPPDRAMRVGAQIAAGLEAAHAAGVIHRDLKPANVLLGDDGRVVLTDFGIARAAGADHRTSETGALVGTPHYMSPEQVRGKRVDTRTDIYALGLILYELVTGALPFEADSAIAVATMRLTEAPADPRRLASVPDPLAELILRCLARDPEERPQCVARVRALLSGVGPSQRPSSWPSASMGGGPSLDSLRTPEGTITGSALYAPLAPSGRALAILPFVYRGSSEHDYLGEGLAEELIDVLSRTKGLKVLALGATRRFTEHRDPKEVGSELGVDSVVDGTVQLAGSKVRISARLLDAADGVQRWSDRFDGPFEDVFELQEKMSRRVAEALRIEVDASAYRSSASEDAIDLYLRSRRGLRSDGLAAPEETVARLDEVLRLAPDLQPAIAAHAMAAIRAWWGSQFREVADGAERARQSVERAERLAPDLGDTHLARAMFHIQNCEYRECAQALGRALEIAPTLADAHHYLGLLQVEAGREREGLERLRLALELDPTLNMARFPIAQRALLRGDLDTHREHVDALVAALPPDTVALLGSRCRWALYRGDLEEARSLSDTARRLTPSEHGLSALLELTLGDGDESAALGAFERSVEVTNLRLRALIFQMAAEVFALAGYREAAFTALERGADELVVDIGWMRRCPLLTSLKDDPRYAAAEAKVSRRASSVWQR